MLELNEEEGKRWDSKPDNVMTVLAVGKLLVQQQGRKSWADSSAPQ